MNVSRLRKLLNAGTSVFLPDVCAGCGIAGAWICDDCRETALVVNQGAACRRCGHPRGAGKPMCSRCMDWEAELLDVRSVYEFSGAVRQSILRMKYHGEHARATWHGRELAALASQIGWGADILVPVPLHANRLRQRGYNQSQKLAEAMSMMLNLDVLECLRRERDTASQTTLNVHQRRGNVTGAFSATRTLANQQILLIDDVATTCSTLTACAAALRDAGARDVRAITIATET